IFTPSVLVMKKDDSRLKIVDKIGRQGKGPGDFLTVTNLQIFDNRYLMVYDRKLYRVTIFDLKTNKVVHIFNTSLRGRNGYFPSKFHVLENPIDNVNGEYYAR